MNPLWDYSLKLYANEDIKQLCLAIQDCYDINVNIVLWCCWYASERGEFSQEFLNQILTDNAPWHAHVTHQLRQARQWLRNQHQNKFVQPFRHQILQLEITSEAFQQKQLYELSINQHKTTHNSINANIPNAARANLQRYFSTLTAKISESHWHLIETNLLTRI
ncbi:TIGR02444 family protein [Legionella maioricensis]|uniref:TIGR02444 family protein n=1 Tax=Legionella maioricensis TaxID=2896528 RepID=A0A9X2ICR2_9GAMM|nr:TIGR02444 family protein [Legionella maioricensis]MCL9685476.1 TIGR02444 family protein [Legionella maioricensis]MCL9689160.1 TIGR02444 family protein [Legionella maioricensis]